MDHSSSSKLMLLTILLLSSSWVSMGYIQEFQGLMAGLAAAAAADAGGAGAAAAAAAAAGGDAAASSMQCMQKLLPCQQYLTSPTPPPPSCCLPLKDMIVNDTKCLCNAINDDSALKALGISKDDALKLPKLCDAQADIGVCSKDASPPLPPPPTAAPPVPSQDAGAKPSNSTSSANGLSAVGGYGVINLFMFLFFSVAF